MIRTVSNPDMTLQEVRNFMQNVGRSLRGTFSSKEREEIERKKREMLEAEDIILKNNGGKNPIFD